MKKLLILFISIILLSCDNGYNSFEGSWEIKSERIKGYLSIIKEGNTYILLMGSSIDYRNTEQYFLAEDYSFDASGRLQYLIFSTLMDNNCNTIYIKFNNIKYNDYEDFKSMNQIVEIYDSACTYNYYELEDHPVVFKRI